MGAKFNAKWAILLCLVLAVESCHYSCRNCTTMYYSGCLSCVDSQLLRVQGVGLGGAGVCAKAVSDNANVLGIFLLLIVAIISIVLRSEEILYFGLFLQSVGMLYILEISWLPALDYLLSAFNYLMIFSRIEYVYKDADRTLNDPNIFKSVSLYKTGKLNINFAIVGIFNLILFLLMILIPTFKAIRKRITRDKVHFLPDSNLDKIMVAVCTFFLLSIQQSVLLIYFSLRYGQNEAAGYVIAIIYFAALVYFIVNQWISPFPFFRSKSAQLNQLLAKILTPIFILFNYNYQFVVFIFLMLFLLADAAINNKNRNNSRMNRLLIFRLVGIVAVVCLMVAFIVEMANNHEESSKMAGVAAVIFLALVLNCYGVEIVIEIKDNYFKSKPEKKRGDKKINEEIFEEIQEISFEKKPTNITEYNFNNIKFDQIQACVERIDSQEFEVSAPPSQKQIKQKGEKRENVDQMKKIQKKEKMQKKEKREKADQERKAKSNQPIQINELNMIAIQKAMEGEEIQVKPRDSETRQQKQQQNPIDEGQPEMTQSTSILKKPSKKSKLRKKKDLPPLA